MRKARLGVRVGVLAGTALAVILVIDGARDGAFASPFGNPMQQGRLPTPDPVTPAPPVDRVAPPAMAATPTQPPASQPPRFQSATPAPRPRPVDSKPVGQPVPQPVAVSPEPAIVSQPAPAIAHEVVTGTGSERSAPAESTDARFTDALRAFIADTRQFGRLVMREADRAAVSAFYEKHGFAPLWTGASRVRAQAVASHIAGIDADGLDPADYRLPALDGLTGAERVKAELAFTSAFLTYARHALDGRVHWSRVANDIDYKPSYDPARVLEQVSSSGDLVRTLDGFNPPHQAYRALRAKYQELRRQTSSAADAPRIGNGPILRIVADRQGRVRMPNDPRVPLLRERLGVPAEDNTAYNRALADAVTRFQKSKGLRATGQFGPATRAALNPPDRAAQFATIRANLERWRWIPRDLGRMHVLVNVPDYHLEVFKDGKRLWRSRAVVGKPEQPTALISDTISTITINPIWHPPASIVYGKVMPAYQAGDRTIFERMGLRVERRQNGEIRVFHPAGDPRNPLGRLRFNFPNKFLVYMHDTPDRQFFRHSRRAFSHGCVRVQDPERFAELLLSMGLPRNPISREDIRRAYGHQERDIRLQLPVRVHQTYQTAFVDETGRLEFRDDIYGLDAKIAALLTGGERQRADTLKERKGDPNYDVKPQERQWLNQVANRAPEHPFALFQDLFR